jgi:hypothetical protein
MYSLYAETCEKNSIKIEFHDVTQEQVPSAVELLGKAFRDIEVIDEETGEVVYSSYVGGDFFNAEATCGEVLDAITELLNPAEKSVLHKLEELKDYYETLIHNLEMWGVE